jgi:hypothetical protein
MDVGAFAQENKRWLLGGALGGVVFAVAYMVIGSINNPGPLVGQVRGITTAAVQADNSVNPPPARDPAKKEAEALKAERERLQAELAYTHDPAWQDTQGLALDEFLGKKGRELKVRLVKEAQRRAVDAGEGVRWTPPTTADEQRAVLFGLELVDAAAQRLWKVDDDQRARTPDAQGLSRLLFTVDAHGARSPLQRLRPGEVDVRDLIEQQKVLFEISGDAALLMAFLESCRQPGKTLTLENLVINPPQKRGDPLTAKGALVGIAFKQA